MPSLAILGPRPAPDTSPSSGWSSQIRNRLSHPTVFLFVILTAQLMVVLDTTIVNVALPHIQSGLHLSGGDLSWVLNAYLLTPRLFYKRRYFTYAAALALVFGIMLLIHAVMFNYLFVLPHFSLKGATGC